MTLAKPQVSALLDGVEPLHWFPLSMAVAEDFPIAWEPPQKFAQANFFGEVRELAESARLESV